MTRRLQSGLYKELLTSALEAEIDARTAEGENGGDKLVHGSGGISQPRAE